MAFSARSQKAGCNSSVFASSGVQNPNLETCTEQEVLLSGAKGPPGVVLSAHNAGKTKTRAPGPLCNSAQSLPECVLRKSSLPEELQGTEGETPACPLQMSLRTTSPQCGPARDPMDGTLDFLRSYVAWSPEYYMGGDDG